MKIEVVNMKDGMKGVTRVDRKTILGNPFRMKEDTVKERNRVCDLYEGYFYVQIEEDDDFKEAVRELWRKWKKDGTLKLGCWCAPKRCHAETIRDFLLCFPPNK